MDQNTDEFLYPHVQTGERKLQFSDSCKFLRDEILGAQNFNFDLKFRQNEGFAASNFVLLAKNLPPRRTFSDRL